MSRHFHAVRTIEYDEQNVGLRRGECRALPKHSEHRQTYARGDGQQADAQHCATPTRTVATVRSTRVQRQASANPDVRTWAYRHSAPA
ncbi:hypothetical protein FOMPIDRAFT_1026689 [Fomitopsis schrenkii]|uniref:Uncharacterized protein n=1 Tax=Fomitopsis schrenkii TaxID=2126942 RepID=S8DH18_FOMSC|nr:hypothetical protein FOMPIDRAFT_1026689 [Fomitopsis schrenkii]